MNKVLAGDTCSNCDGNIFADGDRLKCYGCEKDYGLISVQKVESEQGLVPDAQGMFNTSSKQVGLPPDTSDYSLEQASYNELRELHRALDQNNEHLQKISLYLRDFWWVLIGIPVILIIIAVIVVIVGINK